MEEVRSFDLIAESALDDRAVQEFARALRQASSAASEALAGATRRIAQVELGDLLEPVDLAKALARGGIPFAISLSDDPDTTDAILQLDEASCVAIADIFFGGPGAGSERDLSDIELRAIEHGLPATIGPLVNALTRRSHGHVRIINERTPQLRSSSAVRLDVALTIGETSVSGALYAPDPDRANESLDQPIEEPPLDMPLQIDVELARFSMTAEEVQALSEGDVVLLDIDSTDHATLRAGDTDLLRGNIREVAGRREIEVSELLSS